MMRFSLYTLFLCFAIGASVSHVHAQVSRDLVAPQRARYRLPVAETRYTRVTPLQTVSPTRDIRRLAAARIADRRRSAASLELRVQRSQQEIESDAEEGDLLLEAKIQTECDGLTRLQLLRCKYRVRKQQIQVQKQERRFAHRLKVRAQSDYFFGRTIQRRWGEEGYERYRSTR